MAEGYSPRILTGGENRSDDQIMAAHDGVRRVSGPGLPGGDDGSPLVIMELLQRLRVRDVMRDRNIVGELKGEDLTQDRVMRTIAGEGRMETAGVLEKEGA